MFTEMKRNNWTNEEVLSILEGQKLSGKDKSYCELWNSVVEHLKSTFHDFQRDPKESGAMAYISEKDEIVHIGPELPR